MKLFSVKIAIGLVNEMCLRHAASILFVLFVMLFATGCGLGSDLKSGDIYIDRSGSAATVPWTDQHYFSGTPILADGSHGARQTVALIDIHASPKLHTIGSGSSSGHVGNQLHLFERRVSIQCANGPNSYQVDFTVIIEILIDTRLDVISFNGTSLPLTSGGNYYVDIAEDQSITFGSGPIPGL